ncbi:MULTISPECIES: response regulator [unclassified Janthinobacterium]|uniref:response regulator n=1 Tax=unclassified Janthinobacterium TaxID=2610881 RepID=UPI000371799A|nr:MULTISPECIES: response regulator [unclassified Janthinobacterium]MEC5160335.1 PAS domain S-box-containing protein [Janthinobacterium sp. CG_S6]
MRVRFQHRLPTIRKKLAVVVLVCALPAAVGFALLTHHFYGREWAQIQAGSLITARALVQAVDRDLNAGISVAFALAGSPSLDANDLGAFYAQARGALRPQFPGFNVVLSDRDALQLLNTVRPFGETMSDPGSLERIRRVFQTGKPVISDLFIGAALRRPLVAVHVPVVRNGAVVYCLSIALVPERLGQAISEQRLAANRVVAILDSRGVIVARTHDPQKFVGKKAAPALLERLRHAGEDTIEATTLEGIPVYSMFSRSPTSGWTVVVGVPRSAVLTGMLASLEWIGWTVLLLFAAGFGMAWFLGGKISRSVRALSTSAAALGSGRPLSIENSVFLEADQAAATLLNVEAELLRHRNHLESQIAERTLQLKEANEQMQAARDTAEDSNRKLLDSEREATDNELRIRTVVENVGEGIITLDEHGDIESFNRAASRIFGYAAQEIIGANIQRLMPPAMRAMHRDGMARYLAGGAPRVVGRERVELPGLHKDGSTFLLELAVNAIEIQGRGLFVGIVRDVTEKKRAEQDVRVAMEQAQLANSAKSAFVAHMSHELRTPMNAVLGMAHLMGTTRLSMEQRRYLDMIRSSGNSLLVILNDILDFSKIEAGKVELSPAPFQLSEVLHEVAAIMSVSAGDRDLELAIGVQPDVPDALVGDAMRLQQVLVNLTGNAVKFTHEGEVSVLVELAGQGDGGATLRFIVRDTGIGISAEQQERLFSPFTQADSSTTRRYGGTGLGLTISKGLIDLLQGTVALRSAPGEGSEFCVTLPFALAAGGVARAPSSDLGRLRVLVVDDNPTSRAYLGMTIRAWNWDVDSVASGPQALDSIRRLQADGAGYDVVLVDWRMPGMDGAATMQAIRTLLPSSAMPVVIMASAFGRGKLLQEQATDDPFVLLTKPVTASSLFDTVHEALTQRGGTATERRPTPLMDRRMAARLLLVEDNPINQMVAKGILEHAGATVDVADNGQIALELLRANGAAYDLVLMDVQMPVMDGFSATRLIRQELRLSVPILAMTAGVLEYEREQCIAAGMNDFIGKPIDVEQLLDTILRHLPDSSPEAPPAPMRAGVERSGVFNVATLLSVSEGKPTHLRDTADLVRRVTDNGADRLAQVRQAWNAGRSEDAVRLLHTMRGVIGTLGAQRFVHVALALEEALSDGHAEPAALAALLFSVEQEFAATLSAARAWLNEQGVEGQAYAAVTADEAQLQRFRRLLAERDLAACELYAGLRLALHVRLDAVDAAALDRAMDSLDFQDAAKRVSGISG